MPGRSGHSTGRTQSSDRHRLAWDDALAQLIRCGHRYCDILNYTVRQVHAFLEAHQHLERENLANQLTLQAVAAQGDKAAMDRLRRDITYTPEPS